MPYFKQNRAGIFPFAKKDDTLDPSAVQSIILKLDNSDSWGDILEEDKDLFHDNVSEVANSGMVMGHLPEDVYYTGEKITFTDDELRVYFNGKRLRPNTDYKIGYVNNQNASIVPDDLTGLTAAQKNKFPRITVAAMGQYAGKVTKYFSIIKSMRWK